MVFLRTHRWALVTAFFVAFCAGAPAAIAPIALGGDYKGIQYMYQDDDDIYRARIHEILDGHGAVVSPFLYEYKQESANVAPTGEWFYALPAFIVGLPVIFLAYKFLLPAALFFLVYLFTRALLSEEKHAVWTAVAAGLLVTLGYDFVDYHSMLQILRGAPPGLLVWTRTVNPITGAVALFGFLLLLWQSLERRTPIVIAGGAALLALMVGYYFAWGIALCVLGTLFLMYLSLRDYPRALTLFGIGVLSIVLLVPYLYIALTMFGSNDGEHTATRTGMFFTHSPVFNSVLILATVLGALFFFCAYWFGVWRERSKSWLFIGAMLAASWLAFNEQVITGREIWYHHFVQYTIPFSYITVLAAAHLSVRALAPRLWPYAIAVLIVFTGTYGIHTTTSVLFHINDFAKEQAYGPVMTWLTNNAPKDCVVLAVEKEEKAARLIPAYSQCNTYISTSVFYAIPVDRILHNMLLQLRLQNVSPDDVESYLRAHEDLVRSYLFTDWNQLFAPGDEEWLATTITTVAADYRDFAVGDLEAQIRSYRVDYLLSEGPLAPEVLAQLPHLPEKGVIGQFNIYTFEP